MRFFINKNSLLPELKLRIIQDGLTDYKNVFDELQNASITFSMRNIETGEYKIANKPGKLYLRETDQDEAIPQYYIGYEWKEKDVNKIGDYEAQFDIKLGNGKNLIVPRNEKLYIHINDSYVISSLDCPDKNINYYWAIKEENYITNITGLTTTGISEFYSSIKPIYGKFTIMDGRPFSDNAYLYFIAPTGDTLLTFTIDDGDVNYLDELNKVNFKYKNIDYSLYQLTGQTFGKHIWFKVDTQPDDPSFNKYVVINYIDNYFE